MEVPEIDVDELARLREADAPLIDVRTPDEFAAFHVPGARLIPLGEVEARVDEVPTAGAVYVICQGGGRSRRAAAFLRTQGIDARNVAGGSKAWVEAGFPTEAGE